MTGRIARKQIAMRKEIKKKQEKIGCLPFNPGFCKEKILHRLVFKWILKREALFRAALPFDAKGPQIIWEA